MAQRKNVRIVYTDPLMLLWKVPKTEAWMLRMIPTYCVEVLVPGFGYYTAYGAPDMPEAKRLRKLLLDQNPEWRQKNLGTQYPGDS